MRQHVATCNKVELKDQVFALKQQQKAAGVQNDDSKGSNSDSETILKYVDKVRVSGSQLQHWRMLLAVTTGWSFATVENAHFVTFMQHVSPNFDLPSKFVATMHPVEASLHWLQQACLLQVIISCVPYCWTQLLPLSDSSRLP